VVAGNSGHAVLAQRDYAEFAALPTASGLVITPYSDDLSVLVGGGRITITRSGGLSLTPLTMPVEETPAAMAAEKNGPSFLDFAAWSPFTGGSFLATERRLMQRVARLPPAKANGARLMLARFYLANRFAAEALGLINLIQTSDPGLRGDTQLATMRAAADYMMGRYRDAHNDLAGPSFDADRHAALWRGLTEAGLENWSASHAYLAQAMPVLKKYQPEWQARFRLTDAESELGIGKLELADAAMMRMPHDLGKSDALEAQLTKARIEAETGPCRFFAYPFGNRRDVGAAAWKAVRDAGFSHGFTTLSGSLSAGGNPYLLPRYGLGPRDSHVAALVPLLGAGNPRLRRWQARLA